MIGLLAALTLVSLLAPPAATAADDGVTLDVAMELKTDGSMGITSTITVPAGGSAVDALPLDVPVEGNRTQHFTVGDLHTHGGAEATVDGRTLAVSAPAGRSTVRYSVRGSVADGTDRQQLTWPLVAGWNRPVSRLTASFASTGTPDSPICAYGRVGERRLCTLTQTNASGQVTMQNGRLDAGAVAVFTTLLPAGTVTPTAEFSTEVPPAARPVVPAWILAACVVVGALLASTAYLRRRADEAVASSSSPAELVVRQDDQLVFASPDGVLPGHVGVVSGGAVRPSDIGATVLDLAVRNHLWVAELPGDFQISRRAPLSDVSRYERAVVDALLPDGAETVLASELAGGARSIPLHGAADEIRADAVTHGWVRKRRPLELAGGVLVACGLVAAAVLALVGPLGGAFYAAAVAAVGAGVWGHGRLLPARTSSGSRLASALTGMRGYLESGGLLRLDDADRAMLIGRALPYAHASGILRGWLTTWAPTQHAVDWYRPLSPEAGLAGVATLAALLDGIAATTVRAD
ncbi:DUF2207 domain-containing protein [Tsukamurella sp. 8J]|uniref:DUF2207 family protein n=1 Tax=Tsukamurella sp. 8J TaxID=3031962 RepID=UPI0023B98C79|nr:DUF2207 domain-containing protein [Tsukamurella sp. 8J]MDF0528750.1 DUF2207 domain-containing protein [Tsukamurella sp. 8J]